MSTVDSVNSSLYFSATALASKNVSQKDQDSKTEKTKKTKSFDNLFTEARQNIELDVSIPEIKGMTIEQAKEFFCKYFGCTCNDLYHNKNKGFKSYFLSFDTGAKEISPAGSY